MHGMVCGQFGDTEETRLVRMEGLCWEVIGNKLRKVNLDARFWDMSKFILFLVLT